jgi:predicted RNase H-like HicB family nuclease
LQTQERVVREPPLPIDCFSLKINPIEVIIIPERSMKNIKYVVYREDKYYVAQCLNVDVSSFGTTLDAAVANLKEALELYFEDNKEAVDFRSIQEVILGETRVHA